MKTPAYIKSRSIHSGRLERWLGADRIAQLSKHMTEGGGNGVGWYGPPINLTDVPGSVWISKDGDFIGNFDRGWFESAADAFAHHARKLWKMAGKPIYLPEFRANPAFGVGFASISDALSRASQGYQQMLNGGMINKAGPTGVVNVASTLWRLGVAPAAGSTSSAAPGGSPRTKADTGAMVYNNPASGTLHLIGADFSSTVINNSVLIYDRLFDVAKTMASITTEAVTGVPTRYQNTTTTAMDYIGGNFLMIEVGGTALAATAHNWTVCTYLDDTNAASTLPSVTGNASAIVDRLDQPVSSWFCPLATGDVGIKALTQMQCSASVATGVINFVIGHPIGIMAFPVISMFLPFDWYTNRQQAPRIFDNACLALLELPKPTTTATTYTGFLYANGAA